ncbi:MAG: hypothetical protein CMM87_00275 [Rickettsiales bacterium]|nr:hypothetical protein [Rickettsiales bacterium]|tara:strand:- start:5615 stop:8260 length:2646 start_codon:yes stop_codon:yes gene_type:complete
MAFLDTAIVIGYFILTLAISLWFGWRAKNLKDYAVSSQNFSVTMIVATIFASFTGGNAILGWTEKIYAVGMIAAIPSLGYAVFRYFLAEKVCPKMGQFDGSFTVGGILQKNFGLHGRVIGSSLAVLNCTGIVATQMVALSVVINYFFQIESHITLVFIALFTIIYTTLGGIRAVALTDLIQFLIIIFFIPLVAVYALDAAGGLEVVARQSFITKEGFSQADVLQMALLFVLASIGNFSPVMIHRLLMSRDLKKLSDSLKLSALIEVPTSFVIAIIGGAAFVLHMTSNPSQAALSLIQTILPIGFKGFAVAGMFAVIMSTIDSFINTGSILIVEDLYKPLLERHLKINEVLLAKISGAVMGVLALFISTQFQNIFDVFIFSQELWLPLTLIPIYVTIFGIKVEKKSFLVNGAITLAVFYGIKLIFKVSLPATIFSLLVSFLLFYRAFLWQKFRKKTSFTLAKTIEFFSKTCVYIKHLFIRDLNRSPFSLAYNSDSIQAFGILCFFTNFLGFFIFLDSSPVMNGVRFIATALSVVYMLASVFPTKGRYFLIRSANLLYFIVGLVIPWGLYWAHPVAGAIIIPLVLTVVVLTLTNLKEQVFYICLFSGGVLIFGHFDGQVSIRMYDVSIVSALFCVSVFGYLIRQYVESRMHQLYLVAKNMAHEMNTPLAMITMSAGSLEKKFENHNEKEITQSLSAIFKAVQRLSNFTRLMLMTARETIFSMPVTQLDLTRVVEETIADFPLDINQQHLISFKADHKSIFVKANAELVRAILTNLIKNAIEAMNEMPADQQRIVIELKVDSFYHDILLIVRDSGPGIPADKLGKIFEPLYTTKAHGSGVGLSFCKAAMEYMNGTIYCFSDIKKGTEFVLRFDEMVSREKTFDK